MKSGKQLKEAGIKKATDTAERFHNDWSQQAHETLCQFIKRRKQFRTEEFREYAISKGLPVPPSLRAFGGVIGRARNANLIRHIDYVQVKNPRAHNANASLWAVC